MMNKLIIIKDIVNLILQYILYYITFIEISYISDKNTINYLLPLIVIVYLLISYFARKFSKNIITFALIHLAIFSCNFYLPINNNDKIVISLIALFICFLASEYWWDRNTKPIIKRPYIGFELFFVIFLLISNQSEELFKQVLLILGIIYLLLNVLSIYLENLKAYIKFNEIIEDLPVSNVISSTNLCISCIFIIWFIIVFSIKFLALDKLLTLIISPIINFILYFIFSLLKYITTLVGLSDTDGWVIHPIEEIPDPVQNATNENIFLQMLIQGIKFLLILAVILGISYLIYKYLKNKSSKYQLATDKIETIHKNNKLNSNKKSHFNFISLSHDNNNYKIRKIYFNKISKFKLQIPSINKLLTHLQISKEVAKNSENDISELTNLYEKARYSNTACTKEDVKRAKQS